MQRGERQTTREGSHVRVSDLREQFRSASKPGKAVKPAKHAKRAPIRNGPNADKHKPKAEQQIDRHEELMAKAEKLSQIHHTTSLLKTKPKNDRLQPVAEKKKSNLFLQLVLVMLVAGGVAIALDPGILPEEVRSLDWQGMQYRLDAWLDNVTG